MRSATRETGARSDASADVQDELLLLLLERTQLLPEHQRAGSWANVGHRRVELRLERELKEGRERELEQAEKKEGPTRVPPALLDLRRYDYRDGASEAPAGGGAPVGLKIYSPAGLEVCGGDAQGCCCGRCIAALETVCFRASRPLVLRPCRCPGSQVLVRARRRPRCCSRTRWRLPPGLRAAGSRVPLATSVAPISVMPNGPQEGAGPDARWLVGRLASGAFRTA